MPTSKSLLSVVALAGSFAWVAVAAEIRTTFVYRLSGVSVFVATCADSQEFQTSVNQTTDPYAVDLVAEQSCPEASGTARAAQASTFGTMSVHASGECSVAGDAIQTTSVQADSFILFQTNFTLDQPSPVVLAGTLTSVGTSNRPGVILRFSGTSGPLYEVRLPQLPGDPPLRSFEFGNALPAGSYMLIASIDATMGGSPPPARSGSAGFDLLLALTDCLCDLDDSGDVGLPDLAILLANFANPQPTFGDGDFDSDSDVDLSDLTRLLSRFGTICE